MGELTNTISTLVKLVIFFVGLFMLLIVSGIVACLHPAAGIVAFFLGLGVLLLFLVM